MGLYETSVVRTGGDKGPTAPVTPPAIPPTTTPPKPKPKPKPKPAPKPKPKAKPKPQSPLDKETAAAVRLKFGPAEQQILSQIRGSGARQQQIGSWFSDAQKIINQANTTSQDAYRGAITGVQGEANQAQGLDTQRLDQVLGEMRADAQRRGANVSPEMNQIGSSAISSRRSQLSSELGNLFERGANNTTFLAGRGALNAREGTQAHLAEQNRLATLLDNLAQTKRQEGDYATAYKAQTAANNLKNQLAAQALGIKQQSANTQTANVKSQIATRKANTQIQISRLDNQSKQFAQRLHLDLGKLSDQRKLRSYQKQHHLGPYKPGKPKGSSKGPSAGAQGAAHKFIDQVNITTSLMQSHVGQKGWDRHRIYQLARSHGVSRDVINVAGDLVFAGHLGSGGYATTLSYLRGSGVGLPSSWKR